MVDVQSSFYPFFLGTHYTIKRFTNILHRYVSQLFLLILIFPNCRFEGSVPHLLSDQNFEILGSRAMSLQRLKPPKSDLLIWVLYYYNSPSQGFLYFHSLVIYCLCSPKVLKCHLQAVRHSREPQNFLYYNYLVVIFFSSFN